MYALLSVSDKQGLAPFASALVDAGYTLLSTGGTARLLRDHGLPVTLVRSADTLALVNLTDQALRVRAVEAASTYDVETLVQVTQAYMTAGSRKGARTSPKTLAAYSLAVRDFVPWARDHGVQLLRPGRRDDARR